MRRGKQYTVPEAAIRETSHEQFAKVASEWPIWTRIALWFSSLLHGHSYSTLAKRRMLAEATKQVIEASDGIYDPETDMVGEPLIRVVSQLRNHCRAVRLAVDSILWPEPFGYLRFLVAHHLPEVEQQITEAMKHTFDFSESDLAPVAAATEVVTERVQKVIRSKSNEIVKALTPHWRSAAVLHSTVSTSYESILDKAGGPAGCRTIPLKSIVPSLIRLDQMWQQFDRYWQPRTADEIANFSRNAHPVRPGQIEMVVSSVQNLQLKGHIRELIQIGMGDPLLAFSSSPISADWFEQTLQAYLERIWPYLKQRASRSCRGEIQAALLQDYETDIADLPKIPKGLPTISLGIICVISSNEVFSDLQRAALQLVIDGVFSRNDGRSILHQAINAIETATSEVKKLFLPSDSGPGIAWDYLTKIESGAPTATMNRARQQEYLDSLYEKLVPLIQTFAEGLKRAGMVIATRNDGNNDLGTITYSEDLAIQGVKEPLNIDEYFEMIERSWAILGARITSLLCIEIEDEPG